MNLVEARFDGESVAFGGFRIPLPPGGRPAVREGTVVLGIRPESFEDAALADAALPQLDVEVAVLEELGSDTHVIFPVDAERVEVEDAREAEEDEALIADDGRGLQRAGQRPDHVPAPVPRSRSRSIPPASTSSTARRARTSAVRPLPAARNHRRAARSPLKPEPKPGRSSSRTGPCSTGAVRPLNAATVLIAEDNADLRESARYTWRPQATTWWRPRTATRRSRRRGASDPSSRCSMS